MRALQQQMNEFTDFDNQEDVLDQMRTPCLTWSQRIPRCSKLRRNVRAYKFRLKMCGASQYKPNRSKSTSRTFDRVSVFVKACPMFIARAHMQQLQQSQQLQQPEGWRFVLDTILPGYQWAPQCVMARTPTVHWGTISGKAVGGPNTVQHSNTVQKHGKQKTSFTSLPSELSQTFGTSTLFLFLNVLFLFCNYSFFFFFEIFSNDFMHYHFLHVFFLFGFPHFNICSNFLLLLITYFFEHFCIFHNISHFFTCLCPFFGWWVSRTCFHFSCFFNVSFFFLHFSQCVLSHFLTFFIC